MSIMNVLINMYEERESDRRPILLLKTLNALGNSKSTW